LTLARKWKQTQLADGTDKGQGKDRQSDWNTMAPTASPLRYKWLPVIS